jgi:hypothetical protein
MFLESRDVLIKVEESLDCNLDLVVSEMWECCPQKTCNKLLNVQCVVMGWTQGHSDPPQLHQTKHVRQDRSVHRQT